MTFNATGHPRGVVLSQAAVTESFADRPLRTATNLASAWYAEDFSREFSDARNFTAPNLAVMGWTKKQPSYVAAYATRVRWDAGRRELSYDLEQSPEQAGTQSLGGRRAAQAARQGGSAKLRKCAVFVDGGHGCTCGDYQRSRARRAASASRRARRRRPTTPRRGTAEPPMNAMAMKPSAEARATARGSARGSGR